MRLRCLHADDFSFEVRDHNPETDSRSGPSADLDGAIVVFAAVETTDTTESARVTTPAADRITEMADHLDEQTIAVVPCAQLTETPASRSAAGAVIEDLADRLAFETHTLPLGESISFELDARGHPFANQPFEIEPAERPAGEWVAIGADGSLSDAGTDHPLLDHGQLLDLLPFDQLAAPSESGPVLFDETGTVLPEGVCLRTLVTELATDRLRAYGAVPVERPPGTDTQSVLSADSPQTIFETTATDQERSGLRLTSTVPESDALTELDEQIALLSTLLADLSVPCQPVCRVTAAFVDEHREWLTDLADRFDQALLLERRADSDQPFRLEFAVLDEHSRLAAPAVWLADSADSRAVVRSTPLDDPTRFVAALCRTTAAADRPELPTWLAPIQCRLIPIDPDDIDTCERAADRLESAGVRVDIDDRDLPVSDRLRTADQRWIPYDAVVGEDDGDRLRVTIRAEQSQRAFTPADLAERISEESADWPDSPRFLARRYSDRADLLR